MRAQLFALVLVPCLLNPVHADCGCEGGLVRWLFTVMCGPWCAAPDGAEESAAPSNQYERAILAQWRDLWQRGKLVESLAVIEKAATVQPQSRDIQHARAVTLAVRDAERHGPLPSVTWRAVKNGPQLTFIVSFGPILEGKRLDCDSACCCDNHSCIVAQVIEDAKTVAATPFALRKSEGDEKPGILRAIAFKNLEKVSEQSLRDLLRMEIGKPFDSVRPWEDFIRVEEYLRGIGYLQSRVKMDVIHRDGETRVIFDIHEGSYSLPHEASVAATVVPTHFQLEKSGTLIREHFNRIPCLVDAFRIDFAGCLGGCLGLSTTVKGHCEITRDDWEKLRFQQKNRSDTCEQATMWIDFALPNSAQTSLTIGGISFDGGCDGVWCIPPQSIQGNGHLLPTKITTDGIETGHFRASCQRVVKTDEPDVYLLRGRVRVECRALSVPIFLWSDAVKVNVRTGAVQAMNVLLHRISWGRWELDLKPWKTCLAFEADEITTYLLSEDEGFPVYYR